MFFSMKKQPLRSVCAAVMAGQLYAYVFASADHMLNCAAVFSHSIDHDVHYAIIFFCSAAWQRRMRQFLGAGAVAADYHSRTAADIRHRLFID